MIGRTTKVFYIRWLTKLKILKISLNFRGKKTPTSQPKGANFFTKINHKFCKHSAKQNPKHQVLAHLWSGHVRRDMGKSARFEGQESLHIASSPTDYLFSATVYQMNTWRSVLCPIRVTDAQDVHFIVFLNMAVVMGVLSYRKPTSANYLYSLFPCHVSFYLIS